MTRLEAYRAIVSAPRQHVAFGKIGRRILHEKADGREQMKPRSVAEWFRKHGRRTA